MDEHGPLVSVVIPTYDRPELVTDAVESVLEQTYRPLEIIVVDDHSPMPVEPVIHDAYTSTDDPITVIRHDENRGANAARITGITSANGTYLSFLDDDDRWLPTKLDSQVHSAMNTGSGLVACGQRVIDDAGRTTHIKQPTLDGSVTKALLKGAVVGTFSTVLIDSTAVDAVGPPDVGLPAWQDRDWFIRLSTVCRVSSVRRPLTIRRLGAHAQISDDFETRRDVAYPRILENHRELAATLGCQQAFKATMARKVAAAAIATGHYPDARRFAAKSIRLDPTALGAYAYFTLSLGGAPLYRPVVQAKRAFDRLVRDNIPGSP